jgi:hypothetical protein
VVRSSDDLLPGPAYFQRQMVLTPRQAGYVGSYTREMLSVEQDRDRAFGQMLARFTTCILSGRTVTAKQRATVKVPASWWQHLKKAAGERHAAWMREPSSPWLLFLLPLDILTLVPRVYLIPWFLRRYPVKYAELTAEVRFTRDMLYPGADVDLPSDRFGIPVMYETMEIAPLALEGDPWTLEDYGPARFLDRHDIAREFFRDAGTIRSVAYADPGTVHGILEWLGQHGVNVDQLVARNAL